MFCEMLGMLQVTMTESSDSWVILGAEGGTISFFCNMGNITTSVVDPDPSWIHDEDSKLTIQRPH